MKQRMELVEMKASVERPRSEYAFSERRACRLLEIAVATFRYRPVRKDSELRLPRSGGLVSGSATLPDIQNFVYCWKWLIPNLSSFEAVLWKTRAPFR
jgi:hypothetical protein